MKEETLKLTSALQMNATDYSEKFCAKKPDNHEEINKCIIHNTYQDRVIKKHLTQNNKGLPFVSKHSPTQLLIFVANIKIAFGKLILTIRVNRFES